MADDTPYVRSSSLRPSAPASEGDSDTSDGNSMILDGNESATGAEGSTDGPHGLETTSDHAPGDQQTPSGTDVNMEDSEYSQVPGWEDENGLYLFMEQPPYFTGGRPSR